MILYQLTHQKNISNLKTIIPSLNFKENELGLEIIDFNVTNPMLDELKEYIVDYTPKSNSGLFRKPYPFIHFESFSSIDEWVVVYCIEDFIFRYYTQLDINYVFDIKQDIVEFIKDNYYNESNWNIQAEIQVKEGQILMFRPWLFHSINNGLGHYFFMEKNNDN